MSSGTSPATSVPFVDLRPVHEVTKEALFERLACLAASGQFVNGPQVAEFEAEFAAWCSVPHCVGTASGLDTLRLSLPALGVRLGDEVVLPALTFVATAEAFTQAGATPVLADIFDRG